MQPPWAAARLFILRDSQESNISRRRRGTFYRRNKVGGQSVSEEVRLQYRADNQSVDCWLRELNYNSIIFYCDSDLSISIQEKAINNQQQQSKKCNRIRPDY